MKTQLLLVVLGLVGALLVAGQLARAASGPGAGPTDIQDTQPWWDASGVHLAFSRTAPSLHHVVTATSAGKSLYVAWQDGASRGYLGDRYFLVQWTDETIVTTGGRFAGPNAILHGVDASPSPDGSQVAYLRDGTLYVAPTAGIPPGGSFPTYSPPERAVATGVEPPSWDVTGPAWSPDGTRIAVASGPSLLLVNADGSGSRVRWTGENQSVNPSWSSDGTFIAFENNATPRWQIYTIRADGTERAIQWLYGESNFRFPRFSPVSNTLAYISDKQRLRGGATQYQFALYVKPLVGGVAHKLLDDVHPNSPPAWSPTAALIAVSAGQECKRWGIYVGRSEVGSRFTRRTNLCRFDGTPHADTIHGSPYFDIINGLGGNDRLFGFWGNDKILGENGNDVIVGDAGNDVIFGGPGDDRIYGGTGNDIIIPGNGRDTVDCGPGIDTVEGAGPLDHIAKNCEHVRH